MAESFAAYLYSHGICPLEFVLFLSLKTIKKIPKGKFDSYTLMLQLNPPQKASRYRREGIPTVQYHIFLQEELAQFV